MPRRRREGREENRKPCKYLDLYLRRLEKELSIPEEEILSRMRWDLPILSENSKCSVSLDLPVKNCKPTVVCRKVCYACQGRQFYRQAVRKSLAVNELVRIDPERAAFKIIAEAKGRAVRLAGSGELLPENKELIKYLKKQGGKYWGFTKRIDTYEAVPSLMFSLDASSPEEVLEYVEENVPVKQRCYVRRPEDPLPDLEVGVIFPVHGAITCYAEEVPESPLDCPAVRHKVKSCRECLRCYKV